MTTDNVPYFTVVLAKRLHIGELVNAGDFCFDSVGRVIMACPKCAGVFLCTQSVDQKEPLTLSPSVVGPEHARKISEQVNTPCHHHFWVKDGKAIEVA